MKTFKKFKLTILGALALITAVALNVRHALNNYGILDNKLHVEILAQSNSGKGSGSGSGSGSSGNNGTNTGEHGGYNWPWNWNNGLTKDEYSETNECEIETNTVTTHGSASDVRVTFKPDNGTTISIGSSSNYSSTAATKTESKGKKITCWDGGSENCDEVSCK
jgi:hypothetical protein